MSMKHTAYISPPTSVYKQCPGERRSDIVVVILGFAGAKPKHLEKYEQLYHARGYDTLSFTSPLEKDQSSLLLKNRRDVSGIVADLGKILEERDVALHLLSLNSVFSLCCIEINHPELDLLQKSRGILFDSCPTELGFASVAKFYDVWDVAYADLLKNANFFTRAKFRLQSVFEISRLIKLYSYLAIRRNLGLDNRDWNAYDFLLDHPYLPRVLSFVYSDIDDICEAKYSEKFAHIHKNRGRIVDCLHLSDSLHVQHLRKYPKEYNAFVDRFVDNLRPKAKL